MQRADVLGFEVRVELDVEGDPAWAQIARPAATELGLAPGDEVWVGLPPRDHLRVVAQTERLA